MSVDWAGIGSVLKELINLLAAAGVFITIYFAAKAKWEAEKAKIEAEKATAESKLTTEKVVSLDDTVERNAKATAGELVAVKADVKKVEANTNGMRSELVGAKEEAALFRGQLLGMQEQKAESKKDAMDVREQIKDATETLAKVKITGEKTNVAVEEVKDIVKNGTH